MFAAETAGAFFEWSAIVDVLDLDVALKLIVALVLGAAIGFERERAGKPAGLRTNLLICVGAALLTDLSVHAVEFAKGPFFGADPGRIAAQIVSGIGFIGAGTILGRRGNVLGLTTAATLWVVAAIGMAVGMELYVAATGATALVLVALIPLGHLEAKFLERKHFLLEVIATDLDEPRQVKSWLRDQEIPIEKSRLERSSGKVKAFVELKIQADEADQLQETVAGRPNVEAVEIWEVTR